MDDAAKASEPSKSTTESTTHDPNDDQLSKHDKEPNDDHDKNKTVSKSDSDNIKAPNLKIIEAPDLKIFIPKTLIPTKTTDTTRTSRRLFFDLTKSAKLKLERHHAPKLHRNV